MTTTLAPVSCYNWVKQIAVDAVEASELAVLRAVAQEQTATIQTLQAHQEQAVESSGQLIKLVQTLLGQVQHRDRALSSVHRNVTYAYIAAATVTLGVIASLLISNIGNSFYGS